MAPHVSAATLVANLAGQTHLPVTQLFHKGEVVGKGAFGSVHRGIHIATGAVVALKIINLDIADDDVEAIQKEVSLLSQLRGGETTNVTQYYGCWLDGPRVWIVMDFASGGSVRTLMKAMRGGALEERHTVIIVREVLVALSFLHKAGVIHRDIKAANILITAQGRVVLCDFGVSALLATTHSKRATMVGTPYWMAPEVISGSLYDTKADIWSLGVTIYEMMMKTPPHSEQVPMRAFILITTGPPPRLPENTGSKEMKEFMATCLRELPNDRLTPDELSKSKWIKATSKIPVTMLKELLTTYDGWVQQGGVRDSIIGDPRDEIYDDENAQPEMNWEFDTIRMPSEGIQDIQDIPPPEVTTTASSSYQAPRSLRMLFEDSSVPPPLPETFLRNLGSSRQHAHGLGVAASAPVNPSFLSPALSINSGDSFDPTRKDASDDADLHTAKQSNFAFPRLAAPKPDFDDTTAKGHQRRGHHSPRGSGAGPRRTPSPFKEGKSPSTPPPTAKAASTFKDIRSTKGLPDISIPPTDANAAASSSPSDSQPAVSGTPAISVGRTSDTPPRPGTSMSVADDGSPKNSQQRVRKVASPMNFQFPPPSSSRNGKVTTTRERDGSISSSQQPLSRPHTPSSKDPGIRLGTSLKEASALDSYGLTPPKPLTLHHPASRSMDSPRTATQQNAMAHSGGLFPHAPGLGRSQTAVVYGSQSDSEALGVTDVNRLAPSRIALKRQASVETGLSLGGPRSGALRDALQISALTVDHGFTGTDLLPPSPSMNTTTSPSTRSFTSAYQMQTDSPQIDGSSMNTSSNSTASASTSISSSTSISMVYGPPVQPLNYSALMTADDVQGELARVVEDLAIWLGVVETGLNGLLDAVAQGSATGKPAMTVEEVGEAEDATVDDSYEFEAVEEEDTSTSDVIPTR
ncbi:hypothetical protein FRB99_005702 [Tulasnella sp. 403]|nr:hypothetical protein FRB99_005702 [Tulasnella sp. 403]